MSFRRVVMTLILAASAVLAGCGEEDVVPEELLAPALPEVRVEADGCVVTLTARFRNEADLASVKEFGFYFGRDEVSMDCLKVTKVVGLEYSLIKEDLDYSTTYLFKVWVGNGREEKASELKEVTTGGEACRAGSAGACGAEHRFQGSRGRGGLREELGSGWRRRTIYGGGRTGDRSRDGVQKKRGNHLFRGA